MTTTAEGTGTVERLRTEGVSVRFGAIVAVNDVTFGVGPGELVGLIGPNGAGKTTLFDVISGIRAPSSGRVLIDGADVTERSDMTRARQGLRRTFQRQQVFTWLSVEDNVLAALEWSPWCGGSIADALLLHWPRRLERERRDKVRAVLHRFGLDDVRDRPIGNLPIATIRMVELARAIIGEPTLLLLDEPTSGLRPSDVDAVAQLVSDYRSASGCSVVVVEHDIEFVLGLCDRVTVLEAGVVIFNGTPDDARVDPSVRRAYLG